jgi:hypothetical protein
MFTPRDPTTLSRAELLKEEKDIQDYIQNLTWLQAQLDNLIVQIHVIEPYYRETVNGSGYGAVLETTEGATLRILLKIQRRQLTIRDALAQVRFFLQGEIEQTDTDPEPVDLRNNVTPSDDPFYQERSERYYHGSEDQNHEGTTEEIWTE